MMAALTGRVALWVAGASLSRLKQWALSHWRTVLFLAVSCAFVAIMSAMDYYKHDAELSRGALTTEKERVANYRRAFDAQSAALAALTEARAADDALRARIADRLDALDANDAATREAINELARSNVEVRSYLDTAVPIGVRRLLRDPTAPAPEPDDGKRPLAPGGPRKALPTPRAAAPD